MTRKRKHVEKPRQVASTVAIAGRKQKTTWVVFVGVVVGIVVVVTSLAIGWKGFDNLVDGPPPGSPGADPASQYGVAATAGHSTAPTALLTTAVSTTADSAPQRQNAEPSDSDE